MIPVLGNYDQQRSIHSREVRAAHRGVGGANLWCGTGKNRLCPIFFLKAGIQTKKPNLAFAGGGHSISPAGNGETGHSVTSFRAQVFENFFFRAVRRE